MRQRAWTIGLLGLAALMAAPTVASARIKLITLPPRQRVEIQLDNPNATLVEEERIVPLVKGVNQVDFSWANTQIDPNTIVFRVLPRDEGPAVAKPAVGKAAPAREAGVAAGANAVKSAVVKVVPAKAEAEDGGPLDIKVLSVSYPPNESALVWQVASSGSGSARVRISYLLGNLTKSFNYRAVASHDESALTLSEYVRIQNLANESFGSTELWVGIGPHFHRPIGLNETKEMLVEKYDKVPVRKTYTCDPQAYGYIDRPQNKLLVTMHYVLKNNKEEHLGTGPLPYGKVRIFQDDGRGSTAFLGEDWGKFTPLDDQMKLYVGTAQDVVVKRTIDKNEQQRVAGNLFNRDVVVKYEIENFKDKAVTLDVAESVRGIRNEVAGDTGRDVQWELAKDTTFDAGPDKEDSTYDHLVFHVPLPARGADAKAAKIVQKLHLVIKNEW
jgi:hypothetical protein